MVALDTGSPETSLPPSFVDHVADEMSHRINFTLGYNEDLLVLSCNDPMIFSVTIDVSFGSVTANIPVADFGVVLRHGEQCIVLLRKAFN